MRITLDHNCIINLANLTDIGTQVKAIVLNENHQCFVVNVGASEMREKGVRPDNYQKFEELLAVAGIGLLPRLNPIGIYNVTFFNRCVYGSSDERLSHDIETVLFGNSPKADIAREGIDSLAGKKWLNRLCDVHTMWCHIQYGNEIFLTTDGNFKKETKLPKLLALGAGRICVPGEL